MKDLGWSGYKMGFGACAKEKGILQAVAGRTSQLFFAP
jgi:hypothetical protein